MMIGTVLEQITLTRGLPGAEEKRWVRVRSGGQLLTALDPMDARPGEQVLLAAGPGAARLCPEVPVDAVIVGITGKNG